MKGKVMTTVFVVLILVVLLSGIASAGFGDWLRDLFGIEKDVRLAPSDPATGPDGLLVYYDFEGDFNDKSGLDRHATAVGTVDIVSSKEGLGQAGDFQGSQDFIVEEDGENYLNGLDAFTVLVWIKSDETSTERGFVHGREGHTGDKYFSVRYDKRGSDGGGLNVVKVGLEIDGSKRTLESSSNVQMTEWQHVAWVWESGQQHRLYIDGQLDNPTNVESARSGTVSGLEKLVVGLGSKDNDADEGWDGLIDEFRIYNRVLSQSEIQEIMDPVKSCKEDPDCDDELYCNGIDRCDLTGGPTGVCSVQLVNCDDGIACTIDSCNEGSDSCDHLPDNSQCDVAAGDVCNPTSGCGPPNIGLIAHYEFNNDFTDSSGNGNDATSAAIQFVPGVESDAALLEGDTHFVNIGDSTSLNSPTETGQLSIAFWIKYDSLDYPTRFRRIISKEISAPSRDYLVYYDNDLKKLALSIGNGNAFNDKTTNKNDWVDSQWYHVAVSYDAETNEGSWYVNGEIDNVFTTSLDGELVDTVASLVIGEGILGTLDDVRLYDVVLSDSEVSDLYSDITGSIICGDKICTDGFEDYVSCDVDCGNPGFTVAFTGATGIDAGFQSVLNLVKLEKADLLLVSGDLDYINDPDTWFFSVNNILGPDFPVMATDGNHDDNWDITYGPELQSRASNIGAVCSGGSGGEFGHNTICDYRGVRFLLSCGDECGSDEENAQYIRDGSSNHLWRIASWHSTKEEMQVGSRQDDIEWDVYEAATENGFIVATGSELSYARTRTLSDPATQQVDFSCPDDSSTSQADVCVGTNQNFVFHSGLGGRNIREQARCLPSEYPYGCNQEWASIYSASQGANYGALFITFYGGDEDRKATGYFKDIDGGVIDEFNISSTFECTQDSDCDDGLSCSTESCVAGSCIRVYDNSLCINEGEVCKPNGCVLPGYCSTNSDCNDDGIACTVEVCAEAGICVSIPDDTLCTSGEVCGVYQGCVDSSQCVGCLLEDEFGSSSCLPFGYRFDQNVDSYCDIDGNVYVQKADEDSCQNDFECLSNTCSDGECVGLVKEIRKQGNILVRIICRIRDLINYQDYDECLLAFGYDPTGLPP